MDLPYFSDVTIKSIVIDTEDTYCESGPSSNPPFEYQVGDGTYKEVRTVLDVTGICNNGKKMLFVWVTTFGNPSPDTPCGLDKPNVMRAVVDFKTIYEEAIKILKCNTSGCGCGKNNCTVDAKFADFSLQYFKLTTALELGDWDSAYEAYCYLLRKNPSKNVIKAPARKPCGCNG